MKPRISKKSAVFAVFLMVASILAIPLTVSAGPVLQMSVANSDTQIASPGGSVTYNISLQNTGDASASVNLTISGTPTNWTTGLSSSSVSVSVGNTVTVYLTVGVPNSAQADNVGKAIVVIGTYETSPGTNASKQTTTTTKVSQVYAFSMSVEGAFNKDIAPGSSGTFTLNLSQVSQGNGWNYINLTPTGLQPDGLTISYSANPVSMEPFKFSTATVTVYVPEGQQGKQYSYIVSGQSSGGGSAQTANIIINVTQVWGVSVGAVEAVKYLNPDSQATFTVNVNNTGNKADTFDLASVDFQSPAPGWTETHTSSVGPITPKSIEQATVQVYAPSNASYPTSMQLKVNFTSQSNGSFTRSATITAVINKVNSTYVSANPFINTADPGASTSFAVQVSNTGNGKSTIDLTLPQFPSYFTPSLDTSSLQNLPAGANATVNLTVSVDKSAPVGDSNVVIRATVHDTTATSNFTVIVRVNQIYNLSVFPSGSYSQHVSPSFKVNYGVTVKNNGNGNDSITMSTGTTPAGLTVYYDNYVVSLTPGEQRTINATVEVAKGTPANSHNIELKATSSGGKTANTTIIVIVDQHYEVLATTPAAYNNTKPGGTAKYTVQVRNLGSGTDTFSIKAGGDNPAWVSFSNASLQLNPGEAANITVTVNVPSDALKGNASTTVTATSDSNSTANSTVNLVTVIDQTYGVQAWASPSSAQVKPGENGKYSIIIKNTGNYRDTYYVNLSKNPNNWATLDLASPFVSLNSSEFFTANLTVAVPKDAAVANVTSQVLATSQGNNSVFASADAETSVTAIYSVEILLNNANASVEPTDTVSYEVRVKNTGNSQDTFNLDITGEKRSWATLSSSSVVLPSGSSQSVTINVTVPDNEQPANWSIKFKATSLGNTSQTAEVSLTIIVKAKHDLDLSTSDFQTKKKGDPGTSVVFKINVTNKGPDQDTISLTISGNHTAWATLSQDSVVLAPGAFIVVNLTVQIPSNAPPESYVNKVTGVLKSNNNRTKNMDITVTVGQIYKLEISSLLSENSTAPGGMVTYNVKVKNTGSGNDTIELSAQSYSTWVSFSKSSIDLVSGASENITVTVTVPSKPLPIKGDYNISLIAKSIGNESITGNLTLVMTITQVYAVDSTTNVSVSYVDPGTSASYNISIKNTGNGPDSFSLTKSGDHTDWVTFSSSSISLDPGITGYVTMIVQVPSNAFPQNMTSKINVKSQGNQTVQLNLSVTTTINLLYGLTLTPSTTFIELTSPGSAVFNLTVQNTGNSNDTMEFEAIGARMDWVSFNTSSVLLGPTNSTVVKVTVSPPFAVPYDKLSGNYINAIKVTSRGYSFATATVNLTTRVNITYSFTTSWDTETKTVGPGGKVTFNVTISNQGNIIDTYVLNSQTFTTWVKWSNNNTLIGANSLDTIMMTVDVPSGQAQGDYLLKVEIKSLGNDTKKASKDIKVTVSEIFGVSIASEDIDKEAGQGMTVTYTITVKNTGNVVENIDLKVVEGSYKSWAILSDTTITFGEKGEQDVNVMVSVPSDQSANNYAIIIKAEVRGHTENFAQITLTTVVAYNVEMTTKELNKKGKANEIVTFNVTVKNKGTGNDTFDLNLQDPPADWTATFDFDNFELNRDKNKVVMVTIHIGKDALQQPYQLSLRVQSDGDLTKTAFVTLTVTVERTPALKLESNDMDLTGRPGQTLIYAFRLTNEGNGQDTFMLDIEDSEIANWGSLNKESTILTVKQMEDLVLTISLPSDAATGLYNHTIKVWSEDTPSVFATLTFRTKVEAVYNLVLSTEDTQQEGAPGDEILYSIKMENTGNAVDSYNLEVRDLPNNWEYRVSNNEPTLQAKGKMYLTLYINISANYTKAKADTYSFTLRLESRGNDTISKSLSLSTVVTQMYGIELSAQNAEDNKNIDPNGDDVEFTIVVNNIGNGEDTVTFKVKRYPTGWASSTFSFSPTVVTVLPGDTNTKLMAVRVSATAIDADAGPYTFDIVAVSKNGNEFSQMTLKLEVIKGQVGLSSSDITFSKTSANKGDVITVTVTVRNTGTADMKNVVVTLLANTNPVVTKTITSLKKGEDTQAVLEWQTDAEGSFTMKVRATYGGESPVEQALSKKVSISEKAGGFDLFSGANLPWLLLIVLVLVVVVVYAGTRGGRKQSGPTPYAPPRPAPGPAPVRKPLVEEEEEEEEEEERPAPPRPTAIPAAAPATGASKPKIARIKCPKCGTTKDVTSPVRPIEVKCDKCGARLRLVK